MFWPSPEDCSNSAEVVASPSRKNVDHSVLHELNSMRSEQAEEDVEALELSKQEPGCPSCGQDVNRATRVATSSSVSCGQRHRQGVCRHTEFPI